MIELVPHIIFRLAFGSVFVKGHDVNDCLRVSLLIRLRDPIFTQHPLPFCRKPLQEVSSDSRPREIAEASRGWEHDNRNATFGSHPEAIANVHQAAMMESENMATHRELTRLIIKSYVGHMNRVLRSRYLHIAGRPQHTVHKARETTLLFPWRSVLCFVRVSLRCRHASLGLRRSGIARPVP